MNKGGRPTTYKEEYNKSVDEYLESNQDEEVPVIKGENTSTGFVSMETKLRVKLPTIGGFALFIGVCERVLYQWRDEHPEFMQSLNKIVKEQEKRLLNSGLSGDYNSTIAKLILSSNHGMVERKDQTTDGKALPTPIIQLGDE